MTKNLVIAAGSAMLFILAAGCEYTRVASPEVSGEQKAWEDLLRESYADYEPPPRRTRAFAGHTDERVSSMPVNSLRADDDPADEEVKPAAEEKPAVEEVKPAAEEKPAVEEVKPAAEEAKPAAEEAKPAVEEKPAAEEKPAVEEVKPAAEEKKPAVEEKPAAEEKKPAVAENSDSGKPAPPDPTGSKVYEVKSGDSLGSISRQMYGDARYSGIIFKANTDILKDPDTLSPGMKLIIPQL